VPSTRGFHDLSSKTPFAHGPTPSDKFIRKIKAAFKRPLSFMCHDRPSQNRVGVWDVKNCKGLKLETLPLDELWKLHQEVTVSLASRVEAQKFEVERRLEELGRRFGGSPKDLPQPRPYPPVLPKFRNPARPLETWSGRGRHPHWVLEILATGASLDDCLIQ
jgi:DNA-binding protein H-NS